MADYTTYKNVPLTINVEDDYIDSGWDLSLGEAIHSACNPGSMINTGIAIEAGKSHVVEFEVFGVINGGVKAKIGTKESEMHYSPGYYKEVLQDVNGSVLEFYGEGVVGIRNVKVYSQTMEPVTIAFSEDMNKWVTYYSYAPETIINFIDKFFTCKFGRLWIHNTNPLRNNFYGSQYDNRISYVVNIDKDNDKLWYNIWLKSKGRWHAPVIVTDPSDQFPNGMLTRIKPKNFVIKDGKLWADILRDLKDPRFSSIESPVERELTAIFKGRMMQGPYLTIDLVCKDTTEARVESSEVYYVDVERSV